MGDFNIRSESVDVEQIMTQIRARIKEKRGVDYTEEQIRELATVRLETFLDPKNLRSDLLEQFRRSRPAIQADPPPVEPPYTFSDETIYETHRGALRFIRRLLHPILKLLFNPNPLIAAIHKQTEFNVDLLKREQRRRIEFERSRSEWNALYYEVLHNLVLETTRTGIEVKNLRMRVEALASRLDFSERRVRALEGVVQYRPEVVRSRHRPEPSRAATGAASSRDSDAIIPDLDEPAVAPEIAPIMGAADDAGPATQSDASGGQGPVPSSGPLSGRRRRRRRRGRRGMGMPTSAAAPGGEQPANDNPGAAQDEFEGGDHVDGPEPETPSDPDPQ